MSMLVIACPAIADRCGKSPIRAMGLKRQRRISVYTKPWRLSGILRRREIGGCQRDEWWFEQFLAVLHAIQLAAQFDPELRAIAILGTDNTCRRNIRSQSKRRRAG